MDAEAFVSALRKELIDDLLKQYRDIYKTPLEKTTDPYYIESIKLYNSLNGNQKDVLFDIKRQVIVDTISSLLAIIDNVSMLSVQNNILELKEKDGDPINGELQDIFLIQEESNSVKK